MSRKYRRLIICGIFLIAANLIVLDWFMFRTVYTPLPTGSVETVSGDFARYHRKSFEVVKVVDGDTIDIDIADDGKNYTRIRLWGVDTPEVYGKNAPMYYGKEASGFVKELLENKKVKIFLDEGNDTRGYYGRLLAYVQLESGEFLNEILLRKGYAYADTRFKHSYYHKYKQLESAAKSAENGLWENVKPEDLPDWKRE